MEYSPTISDDSFSKYGVYSISDSMKLTFPDCDIKFERASKKAFSYSRITSDGQPLEKIIPIDSEQIQIEACPIRPLNHPARRTQYVYLKFDKEIYLAEDTAATVFVQCPIEIGLFIIHENHKYSLDWVTCNPCHSRFGLYGSPDTGILCKYYESQIVGSLDDSVPYLNGIIRIMLRNELSRGYSLNKVVFPITDNSVYYNDNMAIFDGLVAILKKRGRADIIDINEEKIETNWTPSPTWESTTSNTQMEMGLD